MQHPNSTALDLFAGPGGWSVACKRLGISETGVENDKAARLTREAAGHPTIHDDVWTYPLVLSLVRDGLIASPPCQTFSAAGKGAGRKALDDVLRAVKDERWKSLTDLKKVGEEVGDDRTALVLTPLTYAWWLDPRWICLEQVPTVLPVWEAVADVLRVSGYSVWTGNLQAEQYGVPQTRKRAVLIASRDGEVGMPKPMHSRYYPRTPEKLDEGVQKWVSMAEALGWTDEGYLRSNYGTGGDPAARGERLLSEPAFTVTSKVDRNKWAMAGAGPAAERTAGQRPRLLDLPAHAITGAATAQWVNLGAPGDRREGSARVTVQQAGVLQSFPADYPWWGSKTKQYQQVGNAIPPLLAEAVLREATGDATA